MTLPEGRKPLSDKDIIDLLKNVVDSFNRIERDIKDSTNKLANTLEQFDIENLDPDKRSWYYDGDGTKRRKE